MKIIKIKLIMQDPRGYFITKGIKMPLTIEIVDEVAVFYFQNRTVTRKFADFRIKYQLRQEIPIDTVFNDRTGKGIIRYIGKTKEEIRDLILKQLQDLNMIAKKQKETEK